MAETFEEEQFAGQLNLPLWRAIAHRARPHKRHFIALWSVGAGIAVCDSLFGLVVKNNIVTNDRDAFLMLQPRPTNSVYANNIFHGPSDTIYIDDVRYSYADGVASLGMTEMLTADPMLVNASAKLPRLWSAPAYGYPNPQLKVYPGDPDPVATVGRDFFKLLPGSPAIGAGVALDQVTHDITGAARPHGSGCDLGAYQTAGARR